MKSLHLTTMEHYCFVVFSVAFVLIKKIKVFQNCIKKRKILNAFLVVPFQNLQKFSNTAFLNEGSVTDKQTAAQNKDLTHHTAQAMLLHQGEGALVARCEVIGLRLAHVISGHRAHGVDHICWKETTQKRSFQQSQLLAR